MRAIVVAGPGDLQVAERPDPVPGPRQVLLGVEWGGICGSDLSYVAHGASGTATLKHPMVLGHEVAGTVLAVGTDVTDVAVGARAAVYPATPLDDRLPERLAGRTNLYPRTSYLGSAATDPHTDGGFSELLVVRADQLRPLPDGVDTRHGALAEPLAVALHALRRVESVLPGGVRGREVLVNGVGPIGALVVAAAKRQGAARVLAADLNLDALAIAGVLGADELFNAAASLPEDVEIVVEASGVGAALGGALRATARGGVLVQVGNLGAQPTAAALGDLVTREITWIGSYRFVDEMDEAIALLADGLVVDPIMTHSFDIDDAAEAFAVAADRSTGSSKVMLKLRAHP